MYEKGEKNGHLFHKRVFFPNLVLRFPLTITTLGINYPIVDSYYCISISAVMYFEIFGYITCFPFKAI